MSKTVSKVMSKVMSHVSHEGAAVVGLGAVTAFGWSYRDLREGLRSGQTAVARPEGFATAGHRTELASEVPWKRSDGPAADSLGALTEADWERLTRADQFAVAAAMEAWNGCFASLPGRGSHRSVPDPGTVGVFFGGSTAGMAEAEGFFARTLARAEAAETDDGREQSGVTETGLGRPRLHSLTSQQLNGPGDAVARALGVAGPVVSFSSACASGALALGAALEALRSGEVEVAVAGGSDSLCQMTYAGFNSLRAVDPELSRPFREGRAGLNLGEGAGVVVLVNDDWLCRLREQGGLDAADEGTESLLERPVRLVGAGASCDAHHMTAPHPEGAGAVASMTAALGDGDVNPALVDFINTHGTGTPHNDSAEAAAIAAVFSSGQDALARPMPITSIKGAIGHLLGSAGAVEAVATVLAIKDGEVQPTTGSESAEPDFCVDLVLGDNRAITSSEPTGVSNSFAFGGANASLLFRRGRFLREDGDQERSTS